MGKVDKSIDNGFGGKVEPGETVAEGALRELEASTDQSRSGGRPVPMFSAAGSSDANV